MPSQVQHAVQHQDADFLVRRVPELARLLGGALGGDGDLAQEPVGVRLAGNESTSVA